MACSHFEIRPRALDHCRIIHGGDLANLLHHVLAYFFGHTLIQKGGGTSEVRIVDVYLLDKLFNRSPLSLSSLIIQTMRNTGYSWDEENQVWTPPSEEDRLRDRNSANFFKIKKTTQTGQGASSLQPVEDDDEANESYNPSDDEENEVGAQNTILMDAFQIEMQTAFEQLRINQEI
ncbi:hypothetical protein M9H77_26735 [Catharanthus roseus]|uniref:Uncharacterized protein n=1 Tax=Catharanthus roseus TaxID=4058 RepID=A0ACC0AAG8_CATRO|nr:hypothetical protein M9H77_26735 [Catharanthus roseus]